MVTVLAAGAQVASAEGDVQSITSGTCVACHRQESDTSRSRISHMRKTPEGWLITIGRMQSMHGLRITPEETSTLVQYLAC